MVDQVTNPLINIPELPFKHRERVDCSHETNSFIINEVKGPKFLDCLSRNIIGALSCTGSIQNHTSLLTIDIPYYWCNFCDFSTILISDIIDHIQCHRFTCKLCDYSAYSRCEVLKHSLTIHKSEIDLKLLRFCVLEVDNVFAENNKAFRKKINISKRKQDADKQTDITCDKNETMLLKKIKLEKPDGELMETSVEVPKPSASSLHSSKDSSNEKISNFGSIMQHLLTASTSDSDHNSNRASGNLIPDSAEELVPNVRKRMELFKSTLNKIADQMKEQNENNKSDPPQRNNQSRPTRSSSKVQINKDAPQSYLRNILTSEENSIEKNTSLIADERQSEQSTSEPTVEIEIDDSYVGTENTKLIVHKPTNVLPSRNEEINVSNCSTPEPVNLPILRTMLTCSETLSSSTTSSVSGEAFGCPKSDVSDGVKSDNDDDDNDDDYDPQNSSSSGEEWGKKKIKLKQKAKGKGRKSILSGFSCPNCNIAKSSFHRIKNHLVREHPQSVLVLRDPIKNLPMYICPSKKCMFSNSDVNMFITHLDSCGIFSEPISPKNSQILTSILITFKNILEEINVQLAYACCFCLKNFDSLETAERHNFDCHRKGCFRNCIFKMGDKDNKAVIICCDCNSEINVLKWCEVAFKDCKEHVRSDIKFVPAVKLNDNIPREKVDTTPQLRAILQQDPTRSASPDTENMPASRMLQWLMSEGSRMMHMLK